MKHYKTADIGDGNVCWKPGHSKQIKDACRSLHDPMTCNLRGKPTPQLIKIILELRQKVMELNK